MITGMSLSAQIMISPILDWTDESWPHCFFGIPARFQRDWSWAQKTALLANNDFHHGPLVAV